MFVFFRLKQTQQNWKRYLQSQLWFYPKKCTKGRIQDPALLSPPAWLPHPCLCHGWHQSRCSGLDCGWHIHLNILLWNSMVKCYSKANGLEVFKTTSSVKSWKTENCCPFNFFGYFLLKKKVICYVLVKLLELPSIKHFNLLFLKTVLNTFITFVWCM